MNFRRLARAKPIIDVDAPHFACKPTVEVPQKKPTARGRKVIAVRRPGQWSSESEDEPSNSPPPRVRANPRGSPRARSPSNSPPRGQPAAFWDIIARFGWSNATDGAPINHAAFARVKNAIDMDAFLAEYDEHFARFDLRLEESGLYDRCDIVSFPQKACVVSHAIALGKDTFEALYNDLEIFQYLILGGDCRSFDDYIRQ